MPNGSILSKNRSIENLIYQLKSGIPPSQLNFSENIADVLQSVNAKLLRDISQLKQEKECQKIELNCLNRKISEETKKSQELAKKLDIERTALANSKKSHEETTKELQKIKTIFSLEGQLNGLGMFII